MGDLNGLNEDQLFKQKTTHEFKTTMSDMHTEQNPYAVAGENPMETVVKKPVQQDIFAREKATEANLFKVLDDAKADTNAYKKQQKSLVNNLAHDEKEGNFSLLDSLNNDPFKIYEWLEAQTSVNGASDEFKAVITNLKLAIDATVKDSMEVADNIQENLAASIRTYLGSHSKKPKHLYGRQRVTVLNALLEKINNDDFTEMVARGVSAQQKTQIFSTMNKEMEMDALSNKKAPINLKRPKKTSEDKKKDAEAVERVRAQVNDISPRFDKRGEEIAEYFLKSTEMKLKEFKKLFPEEKIFARDDDYYLAFLHYTTADKLTSPEDFKSKEAWNQKYMDLYSKVQKSHMLNSAKETAVKNTFIDKKKELSKKKLRKLTKEEEEALKNEVYGNIDLIKIDEADTNEMADMMFERLRSMLDYEVTLDNIKDINWVEAHTEELYHMSTIAGYLDNLAKSPSPTAIAFTQKFTNSPEYKVLNAKVNLFADFASIITHVKSMHGITNEERPASLRDIIANMSRETAIKDSENAGNGPMNEYEKGIKKAITSWETYNKERGDFLK